MQGKEEKEIGVSVLLHILQEGLRSEAIYGFLSNYTKRDRTRVPSPLVLIGRMQ